MNWISVKGVPELSVGGGVNMQLFTTNDGYPVFLTVSNTYAFTIPPHFNIYKNLFPKYQLVILEKGNRAVTDPSKPGIEYPNPFGLTIAVPVVNTDTYKAAIRNELNSVIASGYEQQLNRLITSREKHAQHVQQLLRQTADSLATESGIKKTQESTDGLFILNQIQEASKQLARVKKAEAVLNSI
jgi:hypothetical protein